MDFSYLVSSPDGDSCVMSLVSSGSDFGVLVDTAATYWPPGSTNQTDPNFGKVQIVPFFQDLSRTNYFTLKLTDSSGATSTATIWYYYDKSIDGPQGTCKDGSSGQANLGGAVVDAVISNPKEDQRSPDPIRYANGEMQMYEDDFEPLAGSSLMFRRSYSNLAVQSEGPFGPGWMTSQQPRIVRYGANSYVVRFDADTQSTFTRQTDGNFVGLRPRRSTLATVGAYLVYRDGNGSSFAFHAFDAAIPKFKQGRCHAVYGSGGEAMLVAYSEDGLLASLRRNVANGEVERIVFHMDPARGLITRAERYRDTNGTSTLFESADYTYYTGVVSDFGDADMLRSVRVANGANETMRQFHYRYYRSGESGGFPTGLKVAIGPRNYARLVQAGQDPLQIATISLSGAGAHADKVDKYFTYDSAGRVTKQILRTADIDGSGTYTYLYTPRANPPATPGPNDWMMSTRETMPDASVTLVYTNKNGDILLKDRRATLTATNRWIETYWYDDAWRTAWHITPAAIQMIAGKWYNEAVDADLNINPSSSPYIRDNQGLIERWGYFPAGHPHAGYQKDVWEQVGKLGTPVLQKSYTYVTHTGP